MSFLGGYLWFQVPSGGGYVQEGGYPPPQDMGPGTQQDVVRILL